MRTTGKVFLAVLALGGSVACRRPEAAPAPTAPLRVSVWVDGKRADREAAEHRLTEALRDRLADRAEILPEGTGTEAAGPRLDVFVLADKTRGDVVKDAALIGVKAGIATAEGTSDPGGGLLLGTLVMVVTAPVTATAAEARGIYHNARLGYKPRHLECRVEWQAPGEKSRTLFTLGPWDVVKAMRPMPPERSADLEALQREEAEALARTVCDRLEREFGWRPKVRPAAKEVQGQP